MTDIVMNRLRKYDIYNLINEFSHQVEFRNALIEFLVKNKNIKEPKSFELTDEVLSIIHRIFPVPGGILSELDIYHAHLSNELMGIANTMNKKS